MEKFLRENLEKVKKELEEEVRAVVEDLKSQMEALQRDFAERIERNERRIKANHEDVNGQIYLESLLTESKRQVLQEKFEGSRTNRREQGQSPSASGKNRKRD